MVPDRSILHCACLSAFSPFVFVRYAKNRSSAVVLTSAFSPVACWVWRGFLMAVFLLENVLVQDVYVLSVFVVCSLFFLIVGNGVVVACAQ